LIKQKTGHKYEPLPPVVIPVRKSYQQLPIKLDTTENSKRPNQNSVSILLPTINLPAEIS
jgi:hypothetical protein